VTLRILAFELSVNILLELLHVEKLEWFLQLQLAVGKLQDIVGNLNYLLEKVFEKSHDVTVSWMYTVSISVISEINSLSTV